MSRKKALTPEQINMIEGMAQYRMPTEIMATILGISKETFERMCKRNKKLAEALERGKARGSTKAYTTAFQLAFGYEEEREVWEERSVWNKQAGMWEKHQVPKRIKVKVPPDTNMTRFWMKTQERWREVDRLELTGPDGTPLKVAELPADLRREKIDRYQKLQEQMRRLEARRLEEAKDVTPTEPEAGDGQETQV